MHSSGLQVEKAIKTRRAKLVLLAPNIASIEEAGAEAAGDAEAGPETAGAAAGGAAAGTAAGGTAAAAAAGGGGGGAAESPAAALVALAREREVPLAFALSRQRMGKVGLGMPSCFAPCLLGLHTPVRGRPRPCCLPAPEACLACSIPSRPTPTPLPTRATALPQLLGQRKRASAFAVLDANGVFEELRALLALAEEGRRQWEQARRAQGQQLPADGAG